MVDSLDTTAPSDASATPDGAMTPASLAAPSNALITNLTSSSLGLALVDAGQQVIYANPAFAALIESPGCHAGERLPVSIARRSSAGAQALEHLLASPAAASLQLGMASERSLSLHIAALEGGSRLIMAENFMRHGSHEDRLTLLSQRDPLTGLNNRQVLENVIRHWTRKLANEMTLALLVIDLNRFKQVNDTLGHNVGDTLLKLVTKRLKSATRSEDSVFRLGGDKFAIAHTTGSQPAGAAVVGQRVIELLSRPFLVDGHQVNIGASVGISLFETDLDHPAELLKRADLALHEAKAVGRGMCCFFEQRMESRATKRRAMEISLRRALGLKEFLLHYQPQVNLSTGKVVGFEALIRWQNAERGVISPADFIPLAEEIGEIHAIGEWVIRTACKEAVSWRNALGVAVNVSPIQFDRDDIVAVVHNALAASGLAPQRLELEITESVLMTNTESVMRNLWAIRELGVGIAMDDFGTGYSSLSYLNSFPFSKLKIDQLFIRSEQSSKSEALINAVLTLGKSLGITTIAEGIETQAQYDALAQGGCESAQGYLIGRPMPQNRIASYLSNYVNRSTR